MRHLAIYPQLPPNPQSWLKGAILVLVFHCLACAVPAQAAPMPMPEHSGFIADPTHALAHADRQRISAKLTKLTSQTGAQLGVVVVGDTAPETIEDFSQRIFTTWKLGRTGFDDGILFVLSLQQPRHRMRIHVGYGLEGVIPDVVAKRILAETARPVLDTSGPTAAIETTVDELIGRIAAAELSPRGKMPLTATPAGERLIMGTIGNLLLVLVAVMMLMPRVSMALRYIFVWLVGLLAYLLYAWAADNAFGEFGAWIWLLIALVFQFSYVRSMRAKAQLAAERRAEAKRVAARREGRSSRHIKVEPRYADAHGQPPGLLRWLPYTAAAIAFIAVSSAPDLSLPELGAATVWAAFSLVLGLLMNGTFLRNSSSGPSTDSTSGWTSYDTSLSGSEGSSSSTDHSSSDSSGGDAGGGGDSGGGGASD